MVYVPILFPSWVYPTADSEIALVVNSDAEAQAIVVAPVTPVATPTASIVPTMATKFVKTPTRPVKQTGKDK